MNRDVIADHPTNAWAVVVAAGRSIRFGAPKMFITVLGEPLLHRTLRALWNPGLLEGLLVVVPAERLDDPRLLPASMRDDDRIRVVAGGDDRTWSVKNGLAALPPECRIVLVHDGARPHVSPELIRRVMDGAAERGACVPVLEPDDTIKEVDDDGLVTRTLPRGAVRLVQTPQAFRREVLARAYAWLACHPEPARFTDDAALVEASGHEVLVVPGEQSNRKLTRPADLGPMGLIVPRVGFGYDVHRLQKGRRLVLGGVEVPFESGLAGHSDADVALHALGDALLGAAGLGDIGRLFPDDDPRYADADSHGLLRGIVDRVHEAGYRVASADVTIVAQRPRLADYIDRMRLRMAEAMRVPIDAVGCKATSEEGLGFTGQGLGMAANAVVVLVPDPSRDAQGKSG